MSGGLGTYPGMLPSIDLEGFERIAATPGVTLLDFTAAWCGPCKTVAPILEALAAHYKIRAVAIDVDHEQFLAQRFSVRSMPTLVVWRDGREVGRVVGSRSRSFLAGVIDRALAGDLAITSP
jgi:thioredoxin